MIKDGSIWFPDADEIKNVVTDMVPILFPNYEDSAPDFELLGGSLGQGRNLLESALAQPQQTFEGTELYPSISNKAAALIWSITKNHPFIDGNKRAALTTCFFFLTFNGYMLLAGQSECVELCLRIAASDPSVDQKYISEWISERLIRFGEIDPSSAAQSEKLVRYMSGSSANEKLALFIFYFLDALAQQMTAYLLSHSEEDATRDRFRELLRDDMNKPLEDL